MVMQNLLARQMQFGFMMGFGSAQEARHIVDFAHEKAFDSVWVGDHVAFAVPIMDSLAQLSFVAALTDRLILGTAVYLLPLRHPTPAAKQIATLDRLSAGRLIFGVGIGGEFPAEYAACGIPLNERGARLGESIEVLKHLWTGESVDYQGQYFQLDNVKMLPSPMQRAGPPVWCGGRQPASLARAGRLADGYISYAITPERFRQSLETIAESMEATDRKLQTFGTGHLLFTRIDDDYESAFAAANDHLSARYAMDFSKPTRKYAAIGRPADIAARMRDFYDAGVRHFVLDMVGPLEDRLPQLQRFSEEVRPLLEASVSEASG